jgi:serine protease Do
MVADTPVGKAVNVKYLREGRPEMATITLAERPGASDVTGGGEETPEQEEDGGKLGISINEVTPELARQMKLKVSSGVIIQSVEADGPAGEAGLQRGDVIHRIGRVPVSNRQDLVRALATLKNEKDVVLQIERNGQLQFVSVTLE